VLGKDEKHIPQDGGFFMMMNPMVESVKKNTKRKTKSSFGGSKTIKSF